MSSVARLQKQIYELTDGLFATWLPDDGLNVGDYGRLVGGRFVRDGNLKNEGVAFQEDLVRSSESTFRYSDGAEMTASGNLSGREHISGSNLGVDITFSKKGAFI